jgi:AraC-like DNA-binding protein
MPLHIRHYSHDLFARCAEEPTQRVGALSAVPALLHELGARSREVLARAHLPTDALRDPDARIPYAAMGRLFARAAAATAQPAFGLLAGRAWHLADLGLIGTVVRNCRTVGEALEALTVYQHLNSAGGVTVFTRDGATADLGHAIYAPNVEGVDQIYDAVLAVGCNFMRELAGSRWRPGEVFLPHRVPDDRAIYRSVFGVVPHFDAASCALRFPAHWLERPVEGVDAVRKREALAAIHRLGPPDFVEVARRALRRLLLSGSSSGNALAAMLSMHRRTLNRRLTDEGTTFRALIDDVRLEVARQLLAYSELPLDDVAAALGYAGMGPFTHSFRRWTGMAPGRWRRQHEAQAAAALSLEARRPNDAGAPLAHRRGTPARTARSGERDA